MTEFIFPVEISVVNSKSLGSPIPLTINRCLDRVKLSLIYLILSVTWLMVEEVSEWDHHGGGERPAEAARTGKIVHQHKVLFGCPIEQVWVERQDL